MKKLPLLITLGIVIAVVGGYFLYNHFGLCFQRTLQNSTEQDSWVTLIPLYLYTFSPYLPLKQKSLDISIKASLVKERQRLTLPGVIPVPSALVGLTALFGMGRGDPHRYSHLKLLQVLVSLFDSVLSSSSSNPIILIISLTCSLMKE